MMAAEKQPEKTPTKWPHVWILMINLFPVLNENKKRKRGWKQSWKIKSSLDYWASSRVINKIFFHFSDTKFETNKLRIRCLGFSFVTILLHTCTILINVQYK